jgi:hypothetical protein
MIEAGRASETSVCFNETTWQCIPEGNPQTGTEPGVCLVRVRRFIVCLESAYCILNSLLERT